MFITTDSICRSASTEEIQGNYVRADCSCEYGFAGVFCTEPRMTCILGGVEAPDGESCDCRDDRMNNTGGCCPLGTVFAAADYSSFTLSSHVSHGGSELLQAGVQRHMQTARGYISE